MTDDPERVPLVRRTPRGAELRIRLWQSKRAGQIWSAELREHGLWGVEAQILKSGRLLFSRRFPTRAEAVEWAAMERRQLGKREPD